MVKACCGKRKITFLGNTSMSAKTRLKWRQQGKLEKRKPSVCVQSRLVQHCAYSAKSHHCAITNRKLNSTKSKRMRRPDVKLPWNDAS